MSEFGPETQSHIPWREHRMERDTSSAVTHDGHDAAHNGHQAQQSHISAYDHYSTPPGIPETEEWPAQHHEAHGVGSPHSQTSTSSMVDSPGSRHSSEHRRGSIDMSSAGSAGEQHHMSLSERRQEKRKMKRFRLTHNQTRFLMSEFARQAHPDAAHRERLAREIPGLSPRQVQVWFQNRRAKLKRMSSHDRDSMMKSRALPEDFPIVQTLHPAYGRGMMGTPVASPTEYSPNAGYSHRPDPLRRRHLNDDDIAVSPTTPGYPGLSFAPNTPTTSELMSPVSTGERPSYVGYNMTAPLGPQQRGNPFSRGANDHYRAHPSVPRLQLHENSRSISENTGSPLATSTTYSSQMGPQDDYQTSPGAYSLQGMQYNEPPRSVPPDAPHSPYVHSNPGGFSHPYPSPSPANNNGTTTRTSFPPPLTLSEFKYPQPPLTPHSGTMSGFATAPLAPPQEYQIPQMSAPADATSFSSSYLTRNHSIGSGGHGSPGVKEERGDGGRLSLSGREFGHQRTRSSSHPPQLMQGREV